MDEDLPLYAPGYSLASDRFGNVVDMAGSLTERECLQGHVWRIETGYVTLAADAAYTLINFKTPATGRCYYGLAQVDKSGSEVVVSMVKGGTVADGTAATPFNYNDDIADSNNPFTEVTTGGTVTGGTERYFSLVPGDSNPSSKPGGNTRGQGLRVLSKNTVYSVKFLAKGGAVTFAANVGITYIAEAD